MTLAPSKLILALALLLCYDLAKSQAIRFVECPGGEQYPRCIASDEVCGYRNKPAPPPNSNAGLSIDAPCHVLANGIEMASCFIDDTKYCRTPSVAEIARRDRENKERAERQRHEQLEAERRKAEEAAKSLRLESEAQKILVATKATPSADNLRRSQELAKLRDRLRANDTAQPKRNCRETYKQGDEGFGIGFKLDRGQAEKRLRTSIALSCSSPKGSGYTLLSGPTCESSKVTSSATGNSYESWGCKASYQCTNSEKICDHSPAGGTKQ